MDFEGYNNMAVSLKFKVYTPSSFFCGKDNMIIRIGEQLETCSNSFWFYVKV